MNQRNSREIPKVYDPKACEEKWSQFWLENAVFRATPETHGETFSIVIPPPNVTGRLHMGHALNNTLQDILYRFHVLEGASALWMPGVDHAGIATQSVVERKLIEEEGKTRHDIGREKLVERIWQWKEEYGGAILDQLKALGCSCDWSRLRFTLDEVCARAVRYTFFRMFKDGLIYRGLRLVNWDVELHTAVSDDEVYHETVKGHFWHFRYPVENPGLEDPKWLIVATTRPETMLGDTAVAVNPKDERYQNIVGKNVILPLMNRPIPIITDDWAKMDKGSGCVKITPAHDPNDYQVGLRQKLPMINIMSPDGKINQNGGRFEGLPRYEARKAVVAALQEENLIEKIEEYETEIGHSDRSKTPIEPYLTEQWFVKMADLAQSAMDAVTGGRVKFYPDRYAKTYLDWLGEKRDWCIGRQLWWGHRIPIWYCETCTEEDLEKAFKGKEDITWVRSENESAWLICSRDEDLTEDAIPGHKIRQDEDVLDTWFSSALWPHSTMGWPEPPEDLKGFLESYYPTSVLVTSRDIITLWVARMVMTGLYNMKEVPFHHVYIHPKILDGRGETMSKSKGNGVDPLDVVEIFGADALRFAMCYLTTETQDVRMPVEYQCPHCEGLIEQTKKNMKAKTVVCIHCEKEFATQWADKETQDQLGRGRCVSDRFEIGRNFCNKLWNAARFILHNRQEVELTDESIMVDDTWAETWIKSRLGVTLKTVKKALAEYRFSEVGQTLYQFFWNDFCDWYLELAKPRQRTDERGRKEHTLQVTANVLTQTLKMLHPIIPFITEELWNLLVSEEGEQKTLLSQSLPPSTDYPSNTMLEKEVGKFQELVGAIRNIRGELAIPPGEICDVRFKTKNPDFVKKYFEDICFLTKIYPNLQAGEEIEVPVASSSAVSGEVEVILVWPEDVKGREQQRLEKNVEKLEKGVGGLEKKLSNENFTSKAPAEVVEREKQRLAQMMGELTTLKDRLEKLG